MAREIYERDMDALFLRAFRRAAFQQHFLDRVLPARSGIAEPGRRVVQVEAQVRHAAHTGTIDIMLRLAGGQRLLIENKIDAGYSVTRAGDAQPGRYRASVEDCAARGVTAYSVLLAPALYLAGSRLAGSFDRVVSYEDLRPALDVAEIGLLDKAILQAATPYEPDPNAASGDFFASYYAFAARLLPGLVLKNNPNGDGVRPGGSRTIYVDVGRSLRLPAGLPRPRMSIQCLDSGAASASVKIMIGGLGRAADRLAAPEGLRRAGGYLRAAGGSLGCVIDTPRLNTQRPFGDQLAAAQQGLEAAKRLQDWWNGAAHEVRVLVAKGEERRVGARA